MQTQYNDLSEDAKETIKGMVEYCLNHCIAMGMSEGYDLGTGEPTDLRKELESYVAEPPNA